MSGVDDFYVTGSEFSKCSRGEAIDMVGCHNGVISANYVHDVAQNGVQTKGGSSDVLIHGNRFEDIPQRAINAGGSTGAPYSRPLDAPHEAARISMVANIFLRTGSSPVAFVGCDSCVFANNTIVEPRNYVARILEENTGLAPGHDGFFINNLIVFRVSDLKSWTQVNVGPDTRPETYTFGWNLWFALDDADFQGPTFRDGVPAGANSVTQADPRLVSLDDGNYRIQADSAALGVGRPIPVVAVPDLGFDFTGRRFRDPPSIGAFEIE